MQLTRAAWDEAADPCSHWAVGIHVSSAAPALAAVLLGDVEGDGAQGGVALAAANVASVASALVAVMGRPSSSGSYIWPVHPRSTAHAQAHAHDFAKLGGAQACAARAVVRVRLGLKQAARAC